MKQLLFGFVAASLFLTAPVYAQQPSFAGLIERFDADNDGKLNKQERQQAAAALRAEKQKAELSKQDAVKKFDANGNGRLEGAELSNFRKFAAAQRRGEQVNAQKAVPKQQQNANNNGNFGVGGAGGNQAFGFGGKIPQQQQAVQNGNFGFGGAGGNQAFGVGGQMKPGQGIPQIPNMKNFGVGMGQLNAFTRQMQAFGMGQANQAQQRAKQLQKAGNMRANQAIGIGGAQRRQQQRPGCKQPR